MNYKQIIGVFSRKTQLKNVENIRLNDGKIEINFLKSIVRSISERCFRTEFSPRSRYAWNWNNVSIGTIARLLIPGLRRHLPVITVSRHGTWRIR